MPALADADVLAALQDILQLTPSATPTRYAATVVPRAHTAGYQTVLGALVQRGFTLAQVLAWDRLAEYELDLSLWYALTRSGAYKSVSKETLDALDRREELAKVHVLTAGVPVTPADTADATEQPVYGAFDTGGDVFSWPDPNDARIGQVTSL